MGAQTFHRGVPDSVSGDQDSIYYMRANPVIGALTTVSWST